MKDKRQVEGMNSRVFSEQNKTSANDPRNNPGAIGAQPSLLNPNAGTKKADYKEKSKKD